MRPGVVGDELIEFADGSRVWLDVRDGSAELRRLAALSTRRDLYLRRVEPCFGCWWYQLAFASLQQPGPTIFARVTRYESETCRYVGAPPAGVAPARDGHGVSGLTGG